MKRSMLDIMKEVDDLIDVYIFNKIMGTNCVVGQNCQNMCTASCGK